MYVSKSNGRKILTEKKKKRNLDKDISGNPFLFFSAKYQYLYAGQLLRYKGLTISSCVIKLLLITRCVVNVGMTSEQMHFKDSDLIQENNPGFFSFFKKSSNRRLWDMNTTS